MPRTTAERTRHRLTRRYAVAVVSIAVAAIAAHSLIGVALLQRTRDAHVVNLAGRQRMLSQRIAKEAVLLSTGRTGASAATLRALADEWAGTHRGLLDGDASRGLPGLDAPSIRPALDALSDEIARVQRAVEGLTTSAATGDSAQTERHLGEILEAERSFLPRMDRVVFSLDDASVRTSRRLQWVVLSLLVFILALLAAVARYIFRPSIRDVVRALDRVGEQARLLRTVIDAIPDHIYVKDVEGRATLRNVASARALGFDDPKLAVGHTDSESGSALGTAALRDDLEVIRTGVPLLDKEERGEKGEWFVTTKMPLRDDAGDVVGLVGVTRNVTAIREAAAMFEGLVEHSVAGTAIIQDGHMAYVNPRMAEIFGYTVEEMTGLPALSIVHEDDQDLVRENLRRRIEGEATAISYNARGRTKTGRTIHVELAGVGGEHEGRPAVIGTAMDVTEREEVEQTLYHQAHHDPLTGLPNRALFQVRLDVAVERGDRVNDEAGYAVLFIDLDRFKVVNDTLGHSAGDRLLQKVGERIERVVRPRDTVARFGGDEFAVLLDKVAGPEHAERVAARVKDALSSPIRVDGNDLSVGASVGIVMARADHCDADAVLREADLAMYEAKRAGRGRSATYDIVAHGAMSRRLRLEIDLPQAVERDELRLAYQPIVDLTDGALVGFEALVRWEHPEHGLLYPDAFIGAAEDSGQVAAVDRWVLREASRQMAAWREGLADDAVLMLNVNCTGRDLLESDYTDAVRRIRDEGGDPDHLFLEITESVLVEDPDAVTAELRSLQNVGVRFCIDDFGTGYSSLASLHSLPVDRVKVDRSFVAEMAERTESAALVRTIIRLGQILGKSIVAEGIETVAHLEALCGMGCAYGQGYLFSRPLWPDQVSELLASERPPWATYWADADVMAV
ncbi:EAL domain-containing protein [Rubrivirga marina]|uniref:EAL domain-containing protein n=1 Tax=Rubrivirga marina TaxID=1196024 RepID=UPI0015CA668B|nr:EAL domain-containing protein [Rubrivirga marina]